MVEVLLALVVRIEIDQAIMPAGLLQISLLPDSELPLAAVAEPQLTVAHRLGVPNTLGPGICGLAAVGAAGFSSSCHFHSPPVKQGPEPL